MYTTFHWLPGLPPAVVQFNDLIDGGGVLEPLPLVLPHLLRVASLQIAIELMIGDPVTRCFFFTVPPLKMTQCQPLEEISELFLPKND